MQVLFAANAVFGKIALADLSALGVLGIRVPAAALIFFSLRVAISSVRGWQHVPIADVLRLCGCGLLGIVMNQYLFFEGLARTTATNAVVMSTTVPVFAVGLAIAFGRERATPRRLAGLLVALLGALVVALLGRAALGSLRLSLGIGELYLLANSVFYSLYLVLSRPLFQRYRTDTAISWIFAAGALLLLPLGLRSVIHELPHAPLRALLSLGFIILGPTLAAYFLNGFALRRASASLVAVYIYLQPVVAALLAAYLLGERVSSMTLVGATLIGLGIALVSRGHAEAPQPR